MAARAAASVHFPENFELEGFRGFIANDFVDHPGALLPKNPFDPLGGIGRHPRFQLNKIRGRWFDTDKPAYAPVFDV
jgi:hypothetical protein